MTPLTPPLHSFPPVRACLFDMDGLLLDTEDKYSVCTNTILKKYGREPLPWKIKAQMQGRPGPQSGGVYILRFPTGVTATFYINYTSILLVFVPHILSNWLIQFLSQPSSTPGLNSPSPSKNSTPNNALYKPRSSPPPPPYQAQSNFSTTSPTQPSPRVPSPTHPSTSRSQHPLTRQTSSSKPPISNRSSQSSHPPVAY